MLRSLIRNLLIESRYVSPMEFNGYACKFNFQPNGNTYYFLFKPSIIKTITVYNNSIKRQTMNTQLQQSFINRIKEEILGYAEINYNTAGYCNGAVEISALAAENPYGPTMYDVVLADTPGIMSDNRGTEPGAIKVYEKYLMDRDDVKVLYLDDIDGYGTDDFEGDDCDRNYNAFYDMRDKDLNKIRMEKDAADAREYSGPIDLPLDEEQVQGLSFHLENYGIQLEVEDLLTDNFDVDLFELCEKIFSGKSGHEVMYAIGNQYFSRRYRSRY